MAAAVFEAAAELPRRTPIEVLPGVSAVQAVAARAGAPIGADFAVVSLSDRLKPWPVVEQRLRAIAEADLVLAIYNPASRSRTTQVAEAQQVLLEHRKPDTVVVVGRDVGRAEESLTVTTLAELDPDTIDMKCLLIVGASSTRVTEAGQVWTPRFVGGTVTVHFVGAGPGAADLITLRAASLLAAADVVLYPGTYLDADVLSHCPERPPGRHAGPRPRPDHRDPGRRVSPTGWRSSVSPPATRPSTPRSPSRPPASIVPASSGTSARASRHTPPRPPPSAASSPSRSSRSSVVLTRTQARSTAMPVTESLAAFAATRATLVLHLAITKTRSLAAELVGEYGADCPVVVVHRASQPDELILRGTLASIADLVEDAGLKQAAVILVGRALAREGGESWLYQADRPRSSAG